MKLNQKDFRLRMIMTLVFAFGGFATLLFQVDGVQLIVGTTIALIVAAIRSIEKDNVDE